MTSIFSKIMRLIKRERITSKNTNPKDTPKHIAIIMDGNGRWAQKRGLPRLAGHRAGAKAVREVVETASKLGVKYITLYTFSAENWSRPRNEIDGLMKLLREMLATELSMLTKNNVKLRTIGDLAGIEESTRKQFKEAVAKTKGNTGLTLIIAINYGGRADILQAAERLAKKCGDESGEAGDLSEKSFSRLLSTSGQPDPELIIRTSGEMRLSNFLIWESAYAEFWVTDTLWPDFRKEDLVEAISDYQRRDRRFGGITGENTDAL